MNGTRRICLVALLAILSAVLGAAGLGPADRGPEGGFRTDVPEHPFDVVLARPTATSVTLSVLSYADRKDAVAYGTEKDNLSSHTESRTFKKGEPAEIVLGGLKPDTQYFYRVFDAEGSFHTQRPAGSTFTFTVTADSHLDANAAPLLYKQTLLNAVADNPDFHVDLGDTFMTGKHASRDEAAKQYLAQRYYFGLIAGSAPIFLVLGNHDGEEPGRGGPASEGLAPWANGMRKKYFPNPVADAFYLANAANLQDYYAWTWGDALFVVLDPFWYTPKAKGGGDVWTRTLGREQYDWLRKTLVGSTAKYRFVFIHHLVSGKDPQGRGGIESAEYGEWGGRNADGADGFKEHRPGWAMPIHDLLARSSVTAVFHGHDHFFAKQTLDGIVYQLVPQPGCPAPDTTHNAASYGYTHGDLRNGSGHMRVTVAPAGVTAEFVRALLPEDETAQAKNGSVEYSWTTAHKGPK